MSMDSCYIFIEKSQRRLREKLTAQCVYTLTPYKLQATVVIVYINKSGMQVTIWLTTLASSLVTIIVSTFLSTRFYIRHEERKQKLEVFRGLMSTRHGLIEKADTDTKREFFKYLNETFVVFGKSPDILVALNNFKVYPSRTGDNITLLARSICKDLKIPDSTLQDDFFNEPFTSGL
jgi:hypothetical protein